MKRILIAAAVIVLLPVLAFVAVMASTFSGRKESIDGTELNGGAARLVQDGYVAMFVLPIGEAEVALVDCGNDETGAAILNELKRRGLRPEAVKAVLLTHGHPDHTASCHLFTGAKVYGMAADQPVADGTGRSKGPLPSRMNAPPAKHIKMTDFVKDGDVVNVGNVSVRVFSVPGHTAGSVVYLANGVLFFGDSASAGSDGKFMAAPWVFSDDVPENRRSLEALAKRLAPEKDSVKALAFAHTGPFEDAAPFFSFRAAE